MSYASSDGGATTPADYAARSSALSFAPGETEKTVPVPVVSDALDEAPENFSFDLSGAAGAAVADGHAFATIVDDDPEVTVSAGDASASEGDAATFTVSLSAASGKLITVEYATSGGSATAGADFTAAAGTLAFHPGEHEKSVAVPTLQDALTEGDELFALSLLRPANVVLADAQGTGTIRDDEVAPDPGPGPGTGPKETVNSARNARLSVRARRASGRRTTSSASSPSQGRGTLTATWCSWRSPV